MTFITYPRITNPHTFGEIVRAILSPYKEDKLKIEILNFLDVKDGVFVNSGREAFYLILQSLFEEGDEIIVPAFTCNVLLGGINKSKVKPVFADINRETLNMEYENILPLITDRTKAVVVTHQFGYPTEFKKIIEFCKEKKIVVIEDSASAFGAELNGEKLGIQGDIGFFSFEKSKVISSIEGGVIVGQSEILQKLRNETIYAGTESSLKYIFKSLIDVILFNPFTYNIILIIWGLLGKKTTQADTLDLEVERYRINFKSFSKFQGKLLGIQLSKIKKIIEIRNKTALLYHIEISQSCQVISIPQPIINKKLHTYSRFPILVKNKNSVYQSVKKQGVDLGFTFSYKLPQYFSDEKGEFKNTDFVIENILCIPITNSFKENERIIKKVKRGLDLI